MGRQLNMEQLTFADILQKSFIAMSMGSTDRITTINILANLLVSFLIGMFIFYIYKRTYQGVLYQRSFNISLVLVSCVTSMVIMTISGNLILSLGMVGALSIVRFRTPIKDSMDLIFLFWAIASGLANGVAYYNISIVGSFLLAIFMIFLTSRTDKNVDAYLLVIQFNKSSEENNVMEIIKANVQFFALKSKVIGDNGTSLTIEIKAKDNCLFVNTLKELEAVTRVTLVTYDQELSAT